jgi:alanine racemase
MDSRVGNLNDQDPKSQAGKGVTWQKAFFSVWDLNIGAWDLFGMATWSLGFYFDMPLSNAVQVSIDLARIRQNAEAILKQTNVPIIAVVKADAYGLGASEVASAIGDLVNGFYVFDAAEAVAGRFWDIAHRRTIALNSNWDDPQEYISRHIQPVVWSVDRATAWRKTGPVLSIDTGQQRFACPPELADSVRVAGDCDEAMTHAVTLPQVDYFLETVSTFKTAKLFLHAAGSALLDHPRARMNAVRPGLELYRGAARITARLIEAKDSTGPAGYTGFQVSRFGVILAGYSNGLRKGPCKVNGEIRQVLEVGMQSSFIELGERDHRGDEVLLLGDETGIDEASIAGAWGTSQQEAMFRLASMGVRNYR